MSRLQRLAAIAATLRAQRLSAEAASATSAALTEIGCWVIPWANGEGITVSERDGDGHLDSARDEKLAELRAKGLETLVVITRRLNYPATSPRDAVGQATPLHSDPQRLRAEQAGDRTGRVDPSAGPATPSRSN